MSKSPVIIVTPRPCLPMTRTASCTAIGSECTPTCDARMHSAEYPDAAASAANDSRFIDGTSFDKKLSAMRTDSDRVMAGLVCLWLEKSLVPEPLLARLRPGGVWMVIGADAEIVSCPGVDVQLRRNTGSFEREVHEHAVLGRANDVIAAMHQENWRCVRWNAQA